MSQQVLEIETSDTAILHSRVSAAELVRRSFRPAVTAPERAQWVTPRPPGFHALSYPQGSFVMDTLTGPYKTSIFPESTAATIIPTGVAYGFSVFEPSKTLSLDTFRMVACPLSMGATAPATKDWLMNDVLVGYDAYKTPD